jgi:hypothetical protein
VASLIGMEQLDRPADVGRLVQVLALVQKLIEERLESQPQRVVLEER